MNNETEHKRENLPLVIEPGALMRRSTDVAGVCREIVMRTAVEIQRRKYVKVEGWEAIATAHGCFAGSGETERVYDADNKLIGWRAKGYVRTPGGTVISTGEGFVGLDETDRQGNPTWGARAEYACRAMAQTRAISRACRSTFAHVVVLIDANLSTTPAEEVPADGFVEASAKPTQAAAAPPAPKPATPTPAATKPSASGEQELSGYLKRVDSKPTKAGGTRFGLLIVQDRENDEGGVWCNTFDTKDGALAQTLQGSEVSLRYVVNPKGFKDMIAHSLIGL